MGGGVSDFEVGYFCLGVSTPLYAMALSAPRYIVYLVPYNVCNSTGNESHTTQIYYNLPTPNYGLVWRNSFWIFFYGMVKFLNATSYMKIFQLGSNGWDKWDNRKNFHFDSIITQSKKYILKYEEADNGFYFVFVDGSFHWIEFSINALK